MDNKFYKISKYIKYLVVILLFATLFVPFGTAITRSVHISGNEYLHTHFGTAFNFMFTNTIYSKGSFHIPTIAIMPLISYVLIVISFILMILNLFDKKVKNSFIFTPITLLFTIAASILVLSSHKEMATILTIAITKDDNIHVIETIYKQTSLGFGLYGIAIFGFIVALCCFINLFFEGTVDKIRAKFKK